MESEKPVPAQGVRYLSVKMTKTQEELKGISAGALYADEYELTMSQSFWRHSQNEHASFELFVRTLPGERGYLVAAGLEQALSYLRDFRFAPAELDFLAGSGLYEQGFLDFLAELRFTGEVWALPEGTVIAPGTPLLRLSAPRIEATLVESALLAIVNQQTMIASKAARIVTAAAGRPCWDFSLRRLHGPEASLGVARAAYLAGFAGTATLAAAKAHRIPSTGTMAHHFVQRFGEAGEQAAFEQFLTDYPTRASLLIDSYDPIRGIERAIAAAKATGIPLQGLRLDSGDLGSLARHARRRLDEAGFATAQVIASNDLDEGKIEALLAAGAPIDAFGVGTMLGTSYDAPALGGVYKLVEQEQTSETAQFVIKRAGVKTTDPGCHQVFRTDGPGTDTLALAAEALPGRPLLAQVFADGVSTAGTLAQARERCAAELRQLPAATLRLAQPKALTLARSEALWALRRQLGDTIAAIAEEAVEVHTVTKVHKRDPALPSVVPA